MTQQARETTLCWWILVAGRSSLLLTVFGIIIIVLALLFHPTPVSVATTSITPHQGWKLWLVGGLLSVVLGLVLKSIAYLWRRQLLRLLNLGQSTRMRLRLEAEEDSDSTQYWATLTYPSAFDNNWCWRVALRAPSRKIKRLVGRELSVRVYVDPVTAEPDVIDYEDGFIWAEKRLAIPSGPPASQLLRLPLRGV